MANLTITVDEETLRRARIRAIEHGESVNQYLAQRLHDYAHGDRHLERREQAARAFVSLSSTLSGNSGGRTWTREELHESASRGTLG